MGKKEEREETRSVAPWDPFGALEPWPSFGQWGLVPTRMGRLMDELFREWPAPRRRGDVVPALDVSENDKQYTISVELPGVRKDDVHVELGDGVITIRGEKKSEREETKEHGRYVERTYGSFSRSFRLPADADPDHMDAAFKDGVLTLKVAKSEEAKPRAISIKAG